MRALKCKGLTFTFSATQGNCEVFANFICMGVGKTTQGVSRIAKVVDSCKSMSTRQELLNKIRAAVEADGNDVQTEQDQEGVVGAININ